MGATHLQRLAGAVERALDVGETAEFIEVILQQLTVAFCGLHDEAQSLLKVQPQEMGAMQETAASDPIMPQSAPSDSELNELRDLLESQNLQALDKLAKLSASLSSSLGTVRFIFEISHDELTE